MHGHPKLLHFTHPHAWEPWEPNHHSYTHFLSLASALHFATHNLRFHIHFSNQPNTFFHTFIFRYYPYPFHLTIFPLFIAIHSHSYHTHPIPIKPIPCLPHFLSLRTTNPMPAFFSIFHQPFPAPTSLSNIFIPTGPISLPIPHIFLTHHMHIYTHPISPPHC